MQTVDLTGFTNSAGWNIVHDPDSRMYTIKNARGQMRGGQFTDRAFAELALEKYLLEAEAAAKKMTDSRLAKAASKTLSEKEIESDDEKVPA